MTTAAFVSVTQKQWCELIASEHGPSSPTTRHVLHVIALHMGLHKNFAWPSQETIAKCTALGVRTVRVAIADAKRTGWLHVRESRTDGGRGWRANEYAATVPGGVAVHIRTEQGEAGAASRQPRGEAGAASRQPRGEADNCTTWGRLLPEVRQELPPNLLREPLREPLASAPVENADKVRRQAPHVAGEPKRPDDLKNRFPEKKKNRAQELRHAVGATLVRPINQRVLKLRDDELAAKVRKLQGAGQDDATIKRVLSGQTDKPQLTRVLKAVRSGS